MRNKVSHTTPPTYSEHFQERFLGHHDPFELLLLLDGTFRELFESGVVGIRNGAFFDSHLIEETIIRRRSDA